MIRWFYDDRKEVRTVMNIEKIKAMNKTFANAKEVNDIIQDKGLSEAMKISASKQEELANAIQAFDATVVKKHEHVNPIMVFYHLKSIGFKFEGDMAFLNNLSFEELLKMISNGIEFEEEQEEVQEVEKVQLEDGDIVKISGKEYGFFEGYAGVSSSFAQVFTVGGSEIVASKWLEKVEDKEEKIIATILIEAELGSNIEVYNEDGSYTEVKIIKLNGDFVLINNETHEVMQVTATSTFYNIAVFIVNFYKPFKVVVY